MDDAPETGRSKYSDGDPEMTRNERTAAARLVARLVARDGHVDWRELEFLDRSGAFRLLEVTRDEFMDCLARRVAERFAARGDGQEEGRLAAELARVRERPRRLLVSALLVYLSEIDRDVTAGEVELVKRVLASWEITPEVLQREMRVPAARTRAALGARAAA
jgi:hypothetical protein